MEELKRMEEKLTTPLSGRLSLQEQLAWIEYTCLRLFKLLDVSQRQGLNAMQEFYQRDRAKQFVLFDMGTAMIVNGISTDFLRSSLENFSAHENETILRLINRLNIEGLTAINDGVPKEQLAFFLTSFLPMLYRPALLKAQAGEFFGTD